MSEMENGFAVSVGDGGFVPPLCGSRAFAHPPLRGWH